jgi:hypothetical protein
MDNKSGRFVPQGARLRGQGERYKDYTVALYVPHGIFDTFNNGYKYKQAASGMDKITIAAHRLVLETFQPLEIHYRAHLRPEMADDLEKIIQVLSPERLQVWMNETFVVDHRNSNVFDNHVNNLRWVTSSDNQPHRKAHALNLEIDSHGRPVQRDTTVHSHVESTLPLY